jgi:hypothetical protein
MMGGFFVRFNIELTPNELYEIIRRAKEKVFIVRNYAVYWLFIGGHWVATVKIWMPRFLSYTEYISWMEDASEERIVEHFSTPIYVADESCNDVDAEITSLEIRYYCKQVRRYATFVVEINTNDIEKHDKYILQLVAVAIGETTFTNMFRPM